MSLSKRLASRTALFLRHIYSTHIVRYQVLLPVVSSASPLVNFLFSYVFTRRLCVSLNGQALDGCAFLPDVTIGGMSVAHSIMVKRVPSGRFRIIDSRNASCAIPKASAIQGISF